MRLAMVGTKDAVPALAALLPDPQFSHYARFGLVPIPDPSVDDALRGALKTLKGKLLVGVDRLHRPAKGRQGRGTAGEADVRRRRRSGPGGHCGAGAHQRTAATKTLQDGLAKTKGPLRDGGSRSRPGLRRRADGAGRPQGGFRSLRHPRAARTCPGAVRLAAMHSTIAAETALDRPR